MVNAALDKTEEMGIPYPKSLLSLMAAIVNKASTSVTLLRY